MSKRLMCVLGLLAMVAMSTMLVGCPPKEVADPETSPVAGEPADGPAGPADAADGETWTVGFSNATWEDPWREVQNKEMQLEADKHPEIELIIADGQNDNGKQIETVESFLEQGIDLLIISPREADALTSVVKKVYDSGIPVVTIDRNINEPAYTCFIGGDNKRIGAAAAELVIKHFGDQPAKIVEIEGVPDASATLDRKAGFEEAIADKADLEIVYDQPANYKRAPAVETMTAALTGNQQIDCVYAHNDEMALGAYQAAKSVGRDGEMIIIGIDAVQTEAIKAVMDGNMHATYFYPTCGKDAIQAALKILKGEDVDETITLETTEITAENAEQYYDPENTLVIQG
ncbi:MAG TPA: substrate-binding domain-containing protein [Armatimonadota bacterium]|nr:substrate-binding domain-containing protein [Armatimonadota bacterium]